MIAVPTIAQEISDRLGPAAAPQETVDRIPTFWVAKDRVRACSAFSKKKSTGRTRCCTTSPPSMSA